MTATPESVSASEGRRWSGSLRRLLAGARTRILAAFVVLMTCSTAVSVLAIYELLIVRTSERVNASLRQEVEEFRQLARGTDPQTGRPFGDDVHAIFRLYRARNVPGEGEFVVMFVQGRVFDTLSGTRGGRVSLGDEAARFGDLRRPEGGELETATATVRYLAVPVTRRSGEVQGVFVVASSLTAEQDEVNDAVGLAAIVLLSVLLIASALAWFLAGRVLAPLRLLTDTARSITETDLTRRIPVSGDDEIAELARTFNAMLDRLEGAFASQRSFVSDASHELRTPITIVRGHLELLGDDPDERRDTIALVTDELLDKAVGLGPRRWELEARAEARLVGDRQRLTQAVMGLAQNAVQHTAEDGRVWLGSAVDGEEARLWVRDTGPGVSHSDHARIFERFARASASRRRSEGAGLGLAIVRAIAEAHGGRVELVSRRGAGATFTVVIQLRGPDVSAQR